MKYLKYYKAWMKTGRIQDHPQLKLGQGGLCNALGSNAMGIFTESYNTLSYWAADYENDSFDEIQYGFNPLRQNIVLLLAAINGEL